MSFPGIMLNEDNSHYFYSRAGEELTREKVASWVDQYAGTQVKELALNVNCMRTSYGSAVWDPIWRGYDPGAPDDQPLLKSLRPEARKSARKWIHTAWQLHRDGIDPYATWIARCREKGLSPWISMRMNDVHNVDDEQCYIHSEFWRDNPSLRRVPYRSASWRDRAFDYGRKPVRDHHWRLVRELFERYDFDGFEMDWMRFGFHFRPGREQEGALLLNAFTKRAKALARKWEQKRGHSIKLGARVPASHASALGLGMDAVEWARQGWVDMLVPTPFFESIDNGIRVDIWKKLLRDTSVLLAPGLELLIRPYPGCPGGALHTNSLQTLRGTASSFLDQGADRIYLFNYMDSQTAIDDLREYPVLLREIGAMATMRGKPRRHVLTFQDTWAPGEPQAHALPALIGKGGLGEFRLHTGPRPEAGKVAVFLGVENAAAMGPGTLEVRLNGETCEYAGKAALPGPGAPFPVHAYSAPIPAILRGRNLIEVRANAEVRIGWVEIGIGQ